MIPKIIHFIWLGKKQMPEEHQNYVKKCKEVMPNYNVMIWNEDNFDFSNCKYAMEAYNSKKYGFVADYIRISVLEKYGGIYLDTDVEVIKPFDDLLNCTFFTCFENDAYVQTAILGAEKNNQLIKDMKSFYENKNFIINKKPDLTPNPFYFTYFLYKNYNLELYNKQQTLKKDKDILNIFPCDYFAPINFTTKKLTITENTYAIHHFANSWQGKKQRKEEKFTYMAYKIFGKKFFAFCTRTYTKHIFKKINKEIKSKKTLDIFNKTIHN